MKGNLPKVTQRASDSEGWTRLRCLYCVSGVGSPKSSIFRDPMNMENKDGIILSLTSL